MLKYSSLILLVALTVFWSHTDAMPSIPSYSTALGKRSIPSYSTALALALSKRSPKQVPWKREADDEINDVELSQETQENLVKELLVGLLLVTADNSAEEKVLSEKFKKALETKYDNIDDFGKAVVDIYEEVTGKKTPESGEDSDEVLNLS